jgi:hypothetical protein
MSRPTNISWSPLSSPRCPCVLASLSIPHAGSRRVAGNGSGTTGKMRSYGDAPVFPMGHDGVCAPASGVVPHFASGKICLSENRNSCYSCLVDPPPAESQPWRTPARNPAPPASRRGLARPGVSSAAGGGGMHAAHSRAADDGRLGGEYRQRGNNHGSPGGPDRRRNAGQARTRSARRLRSVADREARRRSSPIRS